MANAKKREDDDKQQLSRNNAKLDILASKLLSSVDSGYAERRRLNRNDSKMQQSYEREMSMVHNRTKGNHVDFIRTLLEGNKSSSKIQNAPKNKGAVVDPYELFTTNAGDIFNYFKDVNNSKYLQISDLKFVSKFVPMLGQAVSITLNSIAASDTISDTIARRIDLPAMRDDEKRTVMETIEIFERDKQLLRKIKNITMKKTLISGESYIYAIKYEDLFDEYAKVLAKKEEQDRRQGKVTRPGKATESMDPNDIVMENYTVGWDYTAGVGYESCISDVGAQAIIDRAVEDYAAIFKPTVSISSYNSSTTMKDYDNDVKLFQDELSSMLESFHLVDSAIPYPCMEDAKIIHIENYRNTYGGNRILDSDTLSSEVAADPKEAKKTMKGFNKLSGLYIKFIDSKNLIPIKVFDTVFGYFYLHTNMKKKKGGNVGYDRNSMVGTGTSPMINYLNTAERKREDAVFGLIDDISRMVMDAFSAKFVMGNSEYIDLISDIIIANGLTDQEYHIQFIPAEYIIPFKVNEDENGNGESIIAESLFPAKLMLYLMITQLLNFINLSGNRQIAHISKGPIDVNTSNMIQDVLRNLQECKVSFNDLLSTNLVYNKLARNINLAIPQSRNGTRLVEFETQEGQDVNMDTDMLERLEELVIIGTKVPISKDMITSPQFAKQIESDNVMYASFIASLQADLEVPLTELYLKIIDASNLPDDLKSACLNQMSVKLPRPKAFENTNNADFLSTAKSMVADAVAVYYGENNNDPDVNMKRDKMTKMIVEDITPFIDWQKMRETETKIDLEIMQEKAKTNDNQGTGAEGGDEGGF